MGTMVCRRMFAVSLSCGGGKRLASLWRPYYVGSDRPMQVPKCEVRSALTRSAPSADPLGMREPAGLQCGIEAWVAQVHARPKCGRHEEHAIEQAVIVGVSEN